MCSEISICPGGEGEGEEKEKERAGESEIKKINWNICHSYSPLIYLFSNWTSPSVKVRSLSCGDAGARACSHNTKHGFTSGTVFTLSYQEALTPQPCVMCHHRSRDSESGECFDVK